MTSESLARTIAPGIERLRPGVVIVTMPEWLATDKGLV